MVRKSNRSKIDEDYPATKDGSMFVSGDRVESKRKRESASPTATKSFSSAETTPKTFKGTKTSKIKTRDRWSDKEHSTFMKGLHKHQRDWEAISEMISTKSLSQVRTHAYNYFARIQGGRLKGYIPPKANSGRPSSSSNRADKSSQRNENKKFRTISKDGREENARKRSRGNAPRVMVPNNDMQQREGHDYTPGRGWQKATKKRLSMMVDTTTNHHRNPASTVYGDGGSRYNNTNSIHGMELNDNNRRGDGKENEYLSDETMSFSDEEQQRQVSQQGKMNLVGGNSPSQSGKSTSMPRVKTSPKSVLQSYAEETDDATSHQRERDRARSPHEPHNKSRRWTKDEHYRFLKAFLLYGKSNWRHMQNIVETKSISQCRAHTYTYLAKVARGECNAKRDYNFLRKDIEPNGMSADELVEYAKTKHQGSGGKASKKAMNSRKTSDVSRKRHAPKQQHFANEKRIPRPQSFSHQQNRAQQILAEQSTSDSSEEEDENEAEWLLEKRVAEIMSSLKTDPRVFSLYQGSHLTFRQQQHMYHY